MHTTAKVIKLVVAAVVVAVLVMLLLAKFTADKPLLPDRAPPDIDENATITESDGNKLDAPENGGALRLNYAKEVTIDLDAGIASLYFENGSDSLQDISIVLVIQDTVILESGLLPPGSALNSLPLPKNGVPLQRGGYDGEILVQIYDANGAPFAVNSAVQGITIEVK